MKQSLAEKVNNVVYELKERFGLIVKDSPSKEFFIVYWENDPDNVQGFKQEDKTELVYTLLYNCEKQEEYKQQRVNN